MPPNGKITWGSFASRGKIATALNKIKVSCNKKTNFRQKLKQMLFQPLQIMGKFSNK